MKKILSILMTTTFCVFIAGCGKSSSSPSGVVESWAAALKAGNLEKANSFAVDEAREWNARVIRNQQQSGREEVPKIAIKREIIINNKTGDIAGVSLDVPYNDQNARTWAHIGLEKVDGTWKVQSLQLKPLLAMKVWIAALEAGDLEEANLLSYDKSQQDWNAYCIKKIKSGKKLPNIIIEGSSIFNRDILVSYYCEDKGTKSKESEARFKSVSFNGEWKLAEVGLELDRHYDGESIKILGETYRASRDYAKALESFQKAAGLGNAEAMCDIAMMYNTGWGPGFPQNNDKAIEWFEKAVKQGNETAKEPLENLKKMMKSYAEQGQRIQKAAEQGDATAQYSLGSRYDTRYGDMGVPKDDVKAAEWYQKAAEQGNPMAQQDLGRMYEDGRGVRQSNAKAIEWYEKASQQGMFQDANAGLKRLKK